MALPFSQVLANQSTPAPQSAVH